MRIRLLREAGGLGDVVRTLSCARAIKLARPDAEVVYYGLPNYAAVVRLCPDVSRLVPVEFMERRRRDVLPDPHVHTYLRDGRFDATVDLFCPAWRHERETRGRVTKDRIDCFIRAAAEVTGLELRPVLPWFALPPELAGRAGGWLEAKGFRLDVPIVAIQPVSCGTVRNWEPDRWVELVRGLRAARVQVLMFQTRKPLEASLAQALRVPQARSVPLDLLMAVSARMSAIVGVDSGLFHVAAAMRVPGIGVFGHTSGRIMRRYYPRAEAVEPEPERWRTYPCAGRPCYGFRESGFARGLCKDGCPAMAEIPAARVLAHVLRRL